MTIGVLWALGVAAEIVLFAFAARLPHSIGPVTLIAIGAAGADRALERNRIRSAARAARAVAAAARAFVRRDASRNDDVSQPERARRKPRRRARRYRDRKQPDDGGGFGGWLACFMERAGASLTPAMAALAAAGGGFAFLAANFMRAR